MLKKDNHLQYINNPIIRAFTWSTLQEFRHCGKGRLPRHQPSKEDHRIQEATPYHRQPQRLQLTRHREF